MRSFVIACIAATFNLTAFADEPAAATTQFVGEELVISVESPTTTDDRFELPANSDQELIAKRAALLDQQARYLALKAEIEALTLNLSFEGGPSDAKVAERIRELLAQSELLLGSVESIEADFMSSKDLFVADSSSIVAEPLAAQFGQ